MLGKRNPQEPLFYYFNMADMIPKNHILRLINKYVDFSFIRSKLKHLYSDMGRPSIDPEVLIRMLLIGYLYGITSRLIVLKQIQMQDLRGRVKVGQNLPMELIILWTTSIKSSLVLKLKGQIEVEKQGQPLR